MKLSTFLFFFPFFFTVSCHRTLPPRGETLPRERAEEYVEIDFDPEPFPEQTQTPTAENEWDVSNVDVSHIDPARKLLSFTFDDAPAKTLENILAVFASFNEENPDCVAHATLFCNGNRINTSNSQALHAATALGWELGNHTFSHPDLQTLSVEEAQNEIDRTDGLLREIDGKPRHLFRAPFGSVNAEIKNALQTPVINWTIDTLDWTETSEEKIYQTVFFQKFSGAIVLMHDGYRHTVSALKRLLPDLKEAGYQVVSVSEMAKANGVTLKKGSEYIRARPTKSYGS